MCHVKGFIFISSLGIVEASHLKINLKRAAFGVKSYRDVIKSFRQRHVYVVAKEKGIKESLFRMDVLGLMLASLAGIVFQSSEVSHFSVRSAFFF